jgi:protein-S-isoprenylcysteine O-methyltransferase Ste14
MTEPSPSRPAAHDAPREQKQQAFGGPIGAVTLMTLLPLLTIYLWACVHRHGGALVWPSAQLLRELPMPSATALACIVAWIAWQLVLDLVLPGRDYTGAPQRDGQRRTYRLNGFLSLLVTLAVVGVALGTGLVHGSNVLGLLGPLLMVAIIFAFAFSAFLYVYGRVWPDADDPSARPGAGAVARRPLATVVYDFFMGTALNPRFGRLDLKMFMESKIGMTSWLVLTIMMAHAEYEQTGRLSLPMALVCIFQTVYTFDFFWFEEAMLSTWDINQENYGFMLAFAFLVWMPFNFSLQSQYLIYADPLLPVWAVVGLLLLNFAGYVIFRSSNLQKHRFRSVPGTRIWGRTPDFIETARGTRLLVSGWWSLARHCNYLGDLMMALAWCLACGFSHIVPYFYFIYFAPLLIDRERRDDHHCAEKYGADWDRYRQRVPYRIVPFVY